MAKKMLLGMAGRDEARDKLRELLSQPGVRVLVYSGRIAASSRVLVPVAVWPEDGAVSSRSIGRLVARALSLRDDGDQGVRWESGGMDAVHGLAQDLGRAIGVAVNAEWI